MLILEFCIVYFLCFLSFSVICLCIFFFFKQKTAYEMRISDWSSDVCSSDLTQPISRNPLLNRICLNSLPTCWWSNIDGDRIEDAGTLSDDGGRHACQVACEGRG